MLIYSQLLYKKNKNTSSTHSVNKYCNYQYARRRAALRMYRGTSEPQRLPSRSLQSRLLSPRVFQSQSKRVVSSVPMGSWWFFLKHWPNTSPHLTPPRGSLGVSGWKYQTVGYLFLGSLAIACVKYLFFLSKSTASVSEASKGNISCSGQNPYNFIPWGRLLALFAVVSRAARAFSLNAS